MFGGVGIILADVVFPLARQGLKFVVDDLYEKKNGINI